MAILINEKTTFIIQGITGKEGSRAAEFMLNYGSTLIGGVTPGKGGQNVHEKPVFNTIQELISSLEKPDATFIAVPAKFAKDAILEAIEAHIPLINVGAENIPIHDVAYCIQEARKKGVRIVGPSSVGIISPGKSKIGFIGGDFKDTFIPGHVGIISKSGGMTQETSLVLKKHGLGVSTAVGMGGDVLAGSDFVDLLELFENDEETHAIALFGEIGGTYEQRVAEYVQQGKITKPIVAFVSGLFTETLDSQALQEQSIGHAGAIIEGNKGRRSDKIKALRDAGVTVVEVHHEIGERLLEIVGHSLRS